MILREELKRERGREERERRNVCKRQNEKEMKRKGRKDNVPTIKLSRLTPRIKRPQRTLGSVTKLLEYFALLK